MNYKAGFIALIGMPNAGKSTLTNMLVGEKVAIVTNKPQTTRKRMTGIINSQNFQAIVVDTPGVVESTSGLNQFLKEELTDVLKTADSIIMLLNLDAKSPEVIDRIMALAKETKKPVAALITKTDLGLGNRANTIKARLENENIPYAEVSNTLSVETVKARVFPLLYNMLPASPAPLYADDILTTENVKDICAELVREKCFEELFEEIPYQLAVQIRAFEEHERLAKIYADVLIEKDNQRKIVIGSRGATLKKIGIQSRLDIEKLLGKKVYLELHVKVKKKWSKDNIVLKELGYVVETR